MKIHLTPDREEQAFHVLHEIENSANKQKTIKEILANERRTKLKIIGIILDCILITSIFFMYFNGMFNRTYISVGANYEPVLANGVDVRDFSWGDLGFADIYDNDTHERKIRKIKDICED